MVDDTECRVSDSLELSAEQLVEAIGIAGPK